MAWLQAIVWANDGWFIWSICASLGLSELNKQQIGLLNKGPHESSDGAWVLTIITVTS